MSSPDQVISQLTDFIRQTFAAQQKSNAVIAVSGGIDSALSLTLLTRALGPDAVTTLCLPFAEQSTADAEAVIEWNQIPSAQRHTINIQPIMAAASQTLSVTPQENVRFGNLQARARMLCVYDVAKKLDALVCGTENKSEHYLGYFTRFGDAASDLEPISTVYKTQVRQLATHLGIPAQILTKPPSAGLWGDQTDEDELGFTYEHADLVLAQLIDQQKPVAEIQIPEISPDHVQKIAAQVKSMAFKRHVPYELEK
jgi:NAD+ synthase